MGCCAPTERELLAQVLCAYRGGDAVTPACCRMSEKELLAQILCEVRAGLPTTAGLLWWHAFEGASYLLDSHTGGHNLTAQNGTPTDTTGAVGQARAVTPNRYMSNGSVSNTFHTSPFTVCCWFRVDDFASSLLSCTQFGTTQATRHWFINYTTAINGFRFGVLDGAASVSIDADTVVASNGTWYHLAFRRNAADLLECFVDGVKQSNSVTYTGTENVGAQQLWYGRSSSSYSNGAFDEGSGWAKALTDAQILALYNAGTGTAYSELPA